MAVLSFTEWVEALNGCTRPDTIWDSTIFDSLETIPLWDARVEGSEGVDTAYPQSRLFKVEGVVLNSHPRFYKVTGYDGVKTLLTVHVEKDPKVLNRVDWNPWG